MEDEMGSKANDADANHHDNDANTNDNEASGNSNIISAAVAMARGDFLLVTATTQAWKPYSFFLALPWISAEFEAGVGVVVVCCC